MTSSEQLDTDIEERFAEQQARLAAMSFPRAPAVGDRAVDFELPNAQGRRIRLTDQLERGPVVLTFYRGAWCPFCNLQLRHLEALGAALLAVSPQLPDGSRAVVDKNGLTFEVLSDLDSAVASAYGITFTLPPIDRALFLEVGNAFARGRTTRDGCFPPRRPSRSPPTRRSITRVSTPTTRAGSRPTRSCPLSERSPPRRRR
jgi:peroxiredoxin